MVFSVDDATDFVGVSYEVDYTASGGDFRGDGELVSCSSMPPDAITVFDDDDANQMLSAALASASTLTGPIDIAACEFDGPTVPLDGDFVVRVIEATAPDLSPLALTVTPRVELGEVIR